MGIKTFPNSFDVTFLKREGFYTLCRVQRNVPIEHKILQCFTQGWANSEKFSANPENTDNYFWKMFTNMEKNSWT